MRLKLRLKLNGIQKNCDRGDVKMCCRNCRCNRETGNPVESVCTRNFHSSTASSKSTCVSCFCLKRYSRAAEARASTNKTLRPRLRGLTMNSVGSGERKGKRESFCYHRTCTHMHTECLFSKQKMHFQARDTSCIQSGERTHTGYGTSKLEVMTQRYKVDKVGTGAL